MPLQAGSRLGPYEILSPLGVGGMGEVYRARDTKLNRDVAIKVLPELFAADPERLARFEREAQTLAALNHPGIAHIHGLEQAAGVRALVMELVEGDDLSTIIARAIYLAHAARAESAQNLVRAYPGPGMYDHAADPDYRLQMYRGHRQLGLPRNGVAALVGVSGLLSLVLAVHNSTVILRND